VRFKITHQLQFNSELEKWAWWGKTLVMLGIGGTIVYYFVKEGKKS
jgi:hypothetical protein